MSTFIHETALLEQNVTVGSEVRIWAFAHVREGVILNDHVILGERVYIGPGVEIGKNSKVQNGAQIFEPATIDQGVFIGPHVVFTNDHVPRAIQANGSQKSTLDWTSASVSVGQGASIGASSVCVAPVRIGEWAMVGAGSVVTRNVSPFSLVLGVPARRVGWICKCGLRLPQEFEHYACGCGALFEMSHEGVREAIIP